MKSYLKLSILSVLLLSISGYAISEKVNGESPHKYSAQFVVRDHSGNPIPDYPYKIESGNGKIWCGVTDKNGNTKRVWMAKQQKVTLYEQDENCRASSSETNESDIRRIDASDHFLNINAKNFITVNDIRIAYDPDLQTPPNNMHPWYGATPVRASFGIIMKYNDPDPDLYPSYLPYSKVNQVINYMQFDNEGYEIDIKSKKRTGYRFYESQGQCYLATAKKPYLYKYQTICKSDGYNFPKTIDISSHPWINIMEQNTTNKYERMPADNVEIPWGMPVKPLIYSDFPITNDGHVSKGRAMCMADCAPGMLMKLLHKGQSIWGTSGKPPTH